MNDWGGKRDGAVRPKLKGRTRKQNQMRATPEEWAIIKAFGEIVKYGDQDAAKDFVEQHKLQQ